MTALKLGRVLRTWLSSLRDRAAARLAALRFNPSREWRRLNRSPFIGDLRFIKLEHRARYRKYFESGSLGQALGALYDAYCTKRLKDQ